MRIHWLCIRICIRLKFVFKFINVVLCNNKSNKLLFVLILWKIQFLILCDIDRTENEPNDYLLIIGYRLEKDIQYY